MKRLNDEELANQTNGVFFLRIEDTDQKREIENGITDIVNSLKDFGIEEDEGMINETEEKENNLEGLERYEKNMENESSSTVTYGGLYGRGVVCGVCG